ncbi:MAG: helix-hairpin-helix domain-containing protein [Thermodesulfobacteriota bacterium]|nr:helix-hairpin-helix domain-containing protein [Thermodesulfobacteriota bacterium]
MPIRNLFILITMMLTVTFLVSPEPVTAKTSTSDSNVSSKASDVKNEKVNINTASAEELTAIVGVGPKTADSIVAYRKQKGKFKNANDLLNIKGIGEKTLLKMTPQLAF